MFSSRFFTQSLCVLLLSLVFVGGTASAQTGTRINPALRPNETVESYRVTPDGKFAVFQISKNIDFGTVESRLYSVDLATNAVKTLSPLFSGNRNLLDYQIAPNSARVIYKADQAADNRFDLYSVAITGGTQTKISRLVSNNGDATDYRISPDSTRVVYEYEEELANYDDVDTLYAVPITGGSAIRLSSNQPEARVGTFFFTTNGSRVVYEFQEPNGDNYRINSVPVAGGQTAFLTDKYYADYYAVTADSNTFVYVADYLGDNVYELYSVPTTGGARILLSQPNENVISFKLANPYAAAVYAYRPADDMNSSNPNAFGVVAATDPETRYNLPINREFSNFDYQISPDNRGVVFSAEERGSQGFFENQLFSATLQSRGEVRRLDNATVRGVQAFQISPDSSRVVFLASPQNTFGTQLYSVPTAGGALVKLSSVAYGDTFSGVNNRFEFTADGKRVVFTYIAETYIDGSGGYDVLSNAIAGGGLRRAASNVDDGFMTSFIVAGSNRVVFSRSTYIYDEETGNTTIMTDLFKATL